MTRRAGRLRDPGLAFAVLLATACLVAAIPWLHAYSSTGAHIALLVAAAAPVLLAALASRTLGLGAPPAFFASAFFMAVTAFCSSGFSPGALGSALLHGPGRLLTETLPLTGGASAVPVVVAVWILGAVAGELAFRNTATSRVTGASLAVPVMSFLLALAVAAPAPGNTWLPAPVLLLAVASAAVARHEWEGRSSASVIDDASSVAPDRRPYRPIGLVVLLAAVVALGVPAIPGVAHARGSVYEPPPTASSLVTDPVASFGALRDQAAGRATPLLRLVTRGRTDGYLTVAVLDTFDGSEWTFASTFDPSGGRVPTPPGSVAPEIGNSSTSATVTVLRSLPVPMLPVFERPSRIVGIPVAVDAVHGMVVADEGIRLPARYTVASVAPDLTLAEIPAVDGIAGTADPGGQAGDLQLPADSSNAIATSARFVTAITGSRPAPTVVFLQEVIAALRRTEKRVVPAAGGVLGGTSLSQVINAVTVNRSATPEQFATFLALVARYVGIPARIATGFRIEPSAAVASLPTGSYSITARQAWTWVEVPVAGMGWVVADPTPLVTTTAGSPPPEQVQATPTTLPAPRANAVPRNQAAGGHAVAKPVRVRRPGHGGLALWALAAAIAGAVAIFLAAGLGIPAFLRRRRTGKRFSTDPALLAGGAWLELLDSLSRAGMDVRTGWTSSEVATEAGRHFGAGVPARVSEVGRVADRAMCSLADPPDFEAAMTAWRSQRQLGEEIQSGLDRRQRALTRISVGAPRREPKW